MIRAYRDAVDLGAFVGAVLKMLGLGLGLGLLLAITPLFSWLLIPFVALYVAGFRIVEGGTEWTDDISDYLAAVEDNNK